MSELLTSDNNPLSPAATRRLRWSVLIVLVIAAIAGSIAILQRQHVREVRAQISDAIATADGMRVAVAVYRARNGGAWPYDDAQAGLLSLSAVQGKYIDNAHIENGRIVITLGGQIADAQRGKQVVLTPWLQGSLVLWHCASRDVAADLLPQDCR
ncbi:MAG TPA: pilin [Rhodanobacteraceae bacterium]|nr:pilin [Rhodanobacteraceae bacterium]